MIATTHTQQRQIICLLCGRPAQQSICQSCTTRVQGQAIALKREAEKGGSVQATRH
jgi:hypothetical protein